MEKTKDNGYRLYKAKFHLDIRTYFTMRTKNDWNNLLRDVGQSSLLEVFKLQLDRVLDELI